VRRRQRAALSSLRPPRRNWASCTTPAASSTSRSTSPLSKALSASRKKPASTYIEAQANSDTQAEQVLRGLARKKLDLIASIGFSQTQAVQKVAKEFPP
jgi:basic membrane lipoprotein Med (substrate-binding protein (PBP1-ABC) superfamily)